MIKKPTRLKRAADSLRTTHAAFIAALREYSAASEADFRKRMPRNARVTKRELRTITHKKRTWVLREPMQLTLDYDPAGTGIVVVSAPVFQQSDWGQGKRDALKNFAGAFAFCWDEYVLVDETTLTLDAQALRQRLRDLVERVKPARKKAKL